jgi:hypothetical protein
MPLTTKTLPQTGQVKSGVVAEPVFRVSDVIAVELPFHHV